MPEPPCQEHSEPAPAEAPVHQLAQLPGAPTGSATAGAAVPAAAAVAVAASPGAQLQLPPHALTIRTRQPLSRSVQRAAGAGRQLQLQAVQLGGSGPARPAQKVSTQALHDDASPLLAFYPSLLSPASFRLLPPLPAAVTALLPQRPLPCGPSLAVNAAGQAQEGSGRHTGAIEGASGLPLAEDGDFPHFLASFGCGPLSLAEQQQQQPAAAEPRSARTAAGAAGELTSQTLSLTASLSSGGTPSSNSSMQSLPGMSLQEAYHSQQWAAPQQPQQTAACPAAAALAAAVAGGGSGSWLWGLPPLRPAAPLANLQLAQVREQPCGGRGLEGEGGGGGSSNDDSSRTSRVAGHRGRGMGGGRGRGRPSSTACASSAAARRMPSGGGGNSRNERGSKRKRTTNFSPEEVDAYVATLRRHGKDMGRLMAALPGRWAA